MKKILLSLVLCFGAVQISMAQTNSEFVTKFLNAVVKKDVSTLLAVLHPDYHREIDKLIAQSSIFKFQNWNFVHAKDITTNDGHTATQYLVAMGVGLQPNEITEDIMSYESRRNFLTPSGHIFLYEEFFVATYNGRKCVLCNADLFDIRSTEQLIRQNGRQLSDRYYTGDY